MTFYRLFIGCLIFMCLSGVVSASRGEMAARRLVVFEHASRLGNAPAHKLFERVRITRNEDKPPRAYSDYTVAVNDADLPEGVTVTTLL